MKTLGVAEARVRGARMALRLHPTSRIAAERLVELVAGGGGRYVLTPDGVFSVAVGEGTGRLSELGRALDLLEPLVAEVEGPAAATGSH